MMHLGEELLLHREPGEIPTLSPETHLHGSLPKATEHDDSGGGATAMLRGLFQTFEGARVRYCILHGYETYAQRIHSDVDGIVDPQVSPHELYSMLYHNRSLVGDLVRCSGYSIVLGGKSVQGSTEFLTLDLGVNCEVRGLPIKPGKEVLAARQRHGQCWIPTAKMEFACYLARNVAKGRFDDKREHRLSYLYKQDPAGCREQVLRSWGERSANIILSAARSSDWDEVHRKLGSLRTELRLRTMLHSPLAFARNKLRAATNRATRILRPEGLNVVFLGPDGAGKSSVVDAVGPALAGAFSRWTCLGFAPPVLRGLVRPEPRKTDQPHALPARSFLTSLLRATYWIVYYTFRYPVLRLALARSTLVLNDRDFLDIFVDQKRYRYGGPLWLLRLIWRLTPKPDLIILLDAPADVLQARKQEVSLEETTRQRNAYAALVRSLGNGRIVDAAQPLQGVTNDVCDVIVQHLTARTARRLGLNQA
jgi:thymidylate kinase